MSNLFLRTLREDPTDAEVPSHRLLVRAGYIRRAAPGGFSWLPLGWIVLRNIEQIVREEMDAAGFQEVHFPALLPKAPYETSGRWVDYGDDLFRLHDRHGNDFLLAPTHEEMFTLLVKDLYGSYKDLPLSIYQIQTKYRDEARPRAGLFRGREFLMKDSYSFDVDDEGLQRSYDRHREAYIKTFERLGLPVVIVSAMSGAMGGSASEEFLTPIEVGEDTYVRCPSCGYAANTEAVEVPVPDPIPLDGAPAARVADTPDTPTIETLVDHLNAHGEFDRPDGPWTAADTMKNVVVKLRHPDGTTEPLAVGVPGDREVDEKRLGAQVAPAELEPFEEADFAAHPALVKGYIGPGTLGSTGTSGIRFLVDPRIVDGTRWVTGANEAGKHVIDLTYGRDFTADGVIEAAEVRSGDTCPNCGEALEIARGVEMGHIFQLGRKYADALGLQVQDESGQLVTVTMGSYGIGVSRAVAAIAETNHDDLGLCWPREVAPADVHLVIAGKEGGPQRPAAESLAAEIEAAGLRVLFDDREGVSPGVRFKDAELIGVPTIVVCGRGIDADDPSKSLVEIKDRRSGDRRDVPLGEVVAHLASIG
ncbi:MAG: proline--tRNA ligase [Ilumatobacter sp.]|uniref:proline--tRNA ligase n=1 Tax=Ilumatobacter sp. TaxID=1967498 RepID=UPI002618A8FF|nr:proline--tRNA ligase [Ilumatobacter sp.]MDJ0770248.1 proline--tRNA ligase [Ilumatobacter sp.]